MQNILFRADVGKAHPQEIFARVAVLRHKGVIYIEEGQRFQVNDVHRVWIVGKKMPETGFAFPERLFSPFAFGNIAADADQSNNVASLVAQGDFG